MKILMGSEELTREISRLMRDYRHYSWAIAWASVGFAPYKALLKMKSKIKKLIVGTHFYQTSPDFIRQFLDFPNARFVLQPNGVFHPKLYLFENNGTSWECLMGSANFTSGGFGGNSESMCLISSEDVGASESLNRISALLEKYWNQGRTINDDEIKAYAHFYSLQKHRLEKLSGRYGSAAAKRGDEPKSPMDVPIVRMPWRDYVAAVLRAPVHSFEGRALVLDTARALFKEFRHFRAMDMDSRRALAGFLERSNVQWLWFGSMKGAGEFKGQVKLNNEHLSEALDCIPVEGPIYREQISSFAGIWMRAFPSGGSALATATRLLTMKRPDYFVCVDSKNRTALGSAFGIRVNSMTLIRYWDELVARIQDSVWWREPEPTTALEKRIWMGRAAFLDSLYYRE